MIRYVVTALGLGALLVSASCDTTENHHIDGATCQAVNPSTGKCICTTNAGCTDATPSCDTATGTCGACRSDMGCLDRNGTPRCDAASGTCVACLSGSDCGASTPRCDVSTQTCAGCTSAADCVGQAGGAACDVASGACVECTTHADCAASSSGTRCNPNTHTCAACATNADCAASPAGPICNEAAGTCGNSCSKDAECASFVATPVCDEASAKCVECTVDTEALRCSGRSCSRATKTCTSTVLGLVPTCGSCQGDSECLAGRACVALQGPAQEALGTFCMLKVAAQGCGTTDSNPSSLPYWRPADLVTVDGDSASVCLQNASISCAAINQIGAQCSGGSIGGTANDACGSATTHDGVCFTSSGGTDGSCSYKCADVRDCRSGRSCYNGDVSFCR